MATVLTPYPVVDNNVLVPTSHNLNIASNLAGVGIMTEPNGGLAAVNLDPSFEVKREHVQTGERVRAEMSGNMDTLDYMTDAFSDTIDMKWTPIAGIGRRIYIPYQCAVVLFQWSLFVSPFRIYFKPAQDPAVKPQIAIKTFYDSTAVQHTKRLLPCTYYMVGASPYGTTQLYEDRACGRFDMAHMQTYVAKGWHTLSVTLNIETSDIQEDLNRTINGSVDAYPHLFASRCTIGIKNVRTLLLGA